MVHHTSNEPVCLLWWWHDQILAESAVVTSLHRGDLSRADQSRNCPASAQISTGWGQCQVRWNPGFGLPNHWLTAATGLRIARQESGACQASAGLFFPLSLLLQRCCKSWDVVIWWCGDVVMPRSHSHLHSYDSDSDSDSDADADAGADADLSTTLL
mgnify:CR=1 FL=1